MKKRLNTLNEEMDRIKSLFTEERMFGNLVEQEDEEKEDGGTEEKEDGGTEEKEDGGTEEKEDGGTEEKTDTQKATKPSKAGTDMEGTPMDKGGAKSDVAQSKMDVKDTKGEIKLNAKECINSIKSTYKSVSSAGIDDPDDWKSKNIETVKNIDWCLSNFKNRFEKEGIFKPGGAANKLIDILRLDKPTLVSGGVEGEKYTIKNEKGRDRIFIKKIGKNKFRFRGIKNINLFDYKKSGKGIGKTKVLKQEFVDMIKNQLNLNPNAKLTVTKGMNTNKMDVGVFVVS
jgi:hypothetical protein